jgi:hypothetical protein
MSMMNAMLGMVGVSASGKHLTFIASAISLGATIVIPAGAQAGDIAILCDGDINAVFNPPTDIPTGWISSSNVVGGGGLYFLRVITSYKILVAGDPGATITGMSTGLGVGKTMIVFRPDWTIVSITPSVANEQVTAGDPAAQTLAMSASVSPCIGIASYNSGGDITTRTGVGMTEVANGTKQYLKYIKLDHDESSADITIDMPDSGTINGLVSLYYNLT